MSTLLPAIDVDGLSPRKLKLLNRKEQRYVAARLRGESLAESARIAGLPAWMAKSRELPAVEALVEEATQALAEIRYEQCLVDAVEIHEYLTDVIRADYRDIQNDDGTYRPMSEWPEIWGKLIESRDIEIRYESERSHDGETKDKPGGWDETGAKIVSVKIKTSSKAKWVELAMKHKGVNAMVEPGAKLGAGLSDLANAINLKTVVDLASVCSIEQLEQLRQRAVESQNPRPPIEVVLEPET